MRRTSVAVMVRIAFWLALIALPWAGIGFLVTHCAVAGH